MTELFERHRPMLEAALAALATRGFWTPFPEIPSGKIYGETAKASAEAAFHDVQNRPFTLPGHPQDSLIGDEISPWGPALGIRYPAAPVETLIAASRQAAQVWGAASIQQRVGICLEIVTRLNAQSFLMGHATMHTTGQAFAMAFQAGGPHAQDRALEAIAAAYDEMTRFAPTAQWIKPQGKAPALEIEKHWTLVPRGISLAIGCNTFPTWNSYCGIFASLATGNTVIIKPHPSAILPLALTVKIAREVLAEAGLPADAILLAVDQPEAQITKELATHPDVRLIDYTGSSVFGDWLREHATQARLFTEETGVNSVIIAGTDDFDAMCANLAFSLALYSGQMCTAPQNIYVPQDGIETDQGHKSAQDIAKGIIAAIDALLADAAQAVAITGMIANPATLARIATARQSGSILRDSAPLTTPRSASPLVLMLDAKNTDAYEQEVFGPITFVIRTADTSQSIALAADLARRKGAITAAIYATDEAQIAQAIAAFAQAGVNLSINLTGNIFVNQSAAFSDFHVTGANPAGNASLTDTAFIAPRFSRAMWRRPIADRAKSPGAL